MNKLQLNKEYEFTIKTSDLSTFDVEFSIITEYLNYNIKMPRKQDSDLFQLTIPTLENLPNIINYKIYVYNKNNRFLIDEGSTELINETTITEDIIPSVKIEMVEEPVKETKGPRIDLKDLVRKDYINAKVQETLKQFKKS
jgi:hypothetical protein